MVCVGSGDKQTVFSMQLVEQTLTIIGNMWGISEGSTKTTDERIKPGWYIKPNLKEL